MSTASAGGVPPKYLDKDTRTFAEGGRIKISYQAIEKQAYRRLEILDAATCLDDLRQLRSNRLEALIGKRVGQYSIRINDHWRICFEWPASQPSPCNIEFTDYHD